MKALILGHGYTAGFLTPRLRDRGWQVTGTTRDAPDRVRAAGATPLLWPGDADGVRRAIAGADAILISAGPDQGGDPVLADFAADFAHARPRWLGYLSTTGVYGDRDGGWVDEDSALAPTTRRGRDRVAAEQAWQRLAAEQDLPLPPAEDYATAEMTPMARSFYAESKRVANDLIKRELGVRLIYPDYRAGLAALLEAEDTPA